MGEDGGSAVYRSRVAVIGFYFCHAMAGSQSVTRGTCICFECVVNVQSGRGEALVDGGGRSPKSRSVGITWRMRPF